MIHVLRHYFPLRKAFLVVSETILLTLVVHFGMSLHLRGVRLGDRITMVLAQQGLSWDDAFSRCLVSSFVVSVLAQVAIAFNELYDFRISSSRYERAARFLASAGTAVLLTLSVVVFVRLADFERFLQFPGIPLTQRVLLLTVSLIAGFALLYLWRNLFHFLLRKWNFNERVLILGTGKSARALAEELVERLDTGYEVVKIVALEAPRSAEVDPVGRPAASHFLPRTRRAPDGEPAPVVSGDPALARRRRADDKPRPGEIIVEDSNPGEETSTASGVQPKNEASLLQLVREWDADTIAVALENRRGLLPTDELLECRLAGVIVEEGESLYERVTGKIAVEAMRPSYLIFNQGFVQEAPAEVAKRAIDVIAASIGLVLTWPLMLATAIFVRLDSPGPVLFRQERCGRNDIPFTVFKFRSMRADAEKHSGPVWAIADDPRITRVGRFLRKSRLDELPQLLNVLLGHMSMVGPRPERPHFVEELAAKIPYYKQRHIVKPGLTGWAQINYPYANTIEDAIQKLQYDLFYIKYQSVVFDLSILFNTIKIVLLRKGT